MKPIKSTLPSHHPYALKSFICPCCGNLDDHNNTMWKLQSMLMYVATKAKKFYPITSGYRCLRHNKAVGGAQLSDHMSMLAVDIGCDNATDRFEIVKNLMPFNNEIRLIRLYQNHIHISLRHPQAILKAEKPLLSIER